MLTVYRLEPDNDHFHNFALVDDSASSIYRRFDGTPLGGDWMPLVISAVDTDDELALLGDHALLGTVPVFSARAVVALGDVLRANGELLSLTYARASYFAFNLTTVVQALNIKCSKVNYFSTGRVMSVDAFVFHPEKLLGQSVFKIPELPRAFVFVTDRFVELVRAADLQGFSFVEVWRDSEAK